MFGTALGADDDSHFVDQGIIKSCSESYGFWKYSGSPGVSYTVQGLAPPVVSGDLQPWNCSRLVH
jgi:hypothetical protein